MGVGKDLWMEMGKRYNTQDWSGMALFYASDAVLVDPNGRCEGREAIQAFLEAQEESFSDRRVETLRVIEEGDTAVAECTWRATNTGPFAGLDGSEVPATGKTVEIPIVAVITVRDGKVVKERDYADMAAMLSQLGLLPGT